MLETMGSLTVRMLLPASLLLYIFGTQVEGSSFGLSCGQDETVNILCLPKYYSKFDLPFRSEENLIKIGIEISDVLKIDDKDYSITFSLYFSVEWFEPRLNLSTEFWGPENTTDDNLVPVNLELIHHLWVPNIFIYNLKTFKVIDVLSKLAGLWIDSSKRIYYSQATHITFICPMMFDSFPLDTQICKFQVGSYSYDMSRMVFEVATLGYIQASAQSIILDYEIFIRNLREKDKIFLAGALGNFSLAGFEMQLERHVMSYIITYYLPSGLFVVVSWISFLIPPDIVPGRMALLITLFLVLINIFNNVTTNSPKAEGLTAIEIWMLACILFVFGSLIECAVILFKKQKAHHKFKSSDNSSYPEPLRNGVDRRHSLTPSSQQMTPTQQISSPVLHTKYEKHITNSTQELNNRVELRHTCQDRSRLYHHHIEERHIYQEKGKLQHQASSPLLVTRKGGGVQPGVNLLTHSQEDLLRQELEYDTRQRSNFRQSRDSLKRARCKSFSKEHYSTWHDRYAKVDSFFLLFSPLLFLVFNCIYWIYFYVWDIWYRKYEK